MIVKDIDIERIDPPAYSVRSVIDDAELMELAEDIKRVGLIHPCTVSPCGERYEIVAGHRRYLAHKLLNAKTVRCQILIDTGADADMIKLMENYSRSEIAPLDEALYFSQLIEKHKLSQAQLAIKTGRSPSYIGQRLGLLMLPSTVAEALAAGSITASTAIALGKCPNPDYLPYYLSQAVEQGANARTVSAWIAGCPLAAQSVNPSDLEKPVVPLTSAPPITPSWLCGICQERKPTAECLMIPVCLSCHSQIK
jgi:ParB family chromosome partitioning protein